MNKEKFENDMKKLTSILVSHIVQNGSRDSILKGFVDSNGNLYPITLDTKVLSKVVEFVFIPIIKEFSNNYGYILEEPKYQNHYPDLTFIDINTNKKYAVDIKTTYRVTEKEMTYEKEKYIVKRRKKECIVIQKSLDENEGDKIIIKEPIVDYPVLQVGSFRKKIQEVLDSLSIGEAVNGMTLGAYSGYFRDRESNKNIQYSYSAYSGHYVIGMIYSRDEIEEIQKYSIEQYKEIESPIYDIDMFFIEKYKIATKSPGSGNTKNIGSVKTISKLKNGGDIFKTIEEFDEFWMNHK